MFPLIPVTLQPSSFQLLKDDVDPLWYPGFWTEEFSGSIYCEIYGDLRNKSGRDRVGLAAAQAQGLSVTPSQEQLE